MSIVSFDMFWILKYSSSSSWCNTCERKEARKRVDLLEVASDGDDPVAHDTLVEKFDIKPFSDFTTKWSNFRGFVLGCIDSYDSNQIVILQGFSRSTRFAILRTAQISKSHQKVVQLLSYFCPIFCKNRYFSTRFVEFCTDSDEIFSEFRRMF